MSGARRAQVAECPGCGKTVVGVVTGEECPGCGSVVIQA